MIKHLKLASSVLLLSVASVAAQAGIIGPNDGLEWELRGSLTDVAGHTAEAASDAGWTWATSAQWLSSGLDNLTISVQSEIDAFEGVCDGTMGFCDGFFADFNVGSVLVPSIICVDCAEHGSTPLDAWSYDEFPVAIGYRVSFASPSSSVPEPASLALLGLGLLGMGLTRRRVQH